MTDDANIRLIRLVNRLAEPAQVEFRPWQGQSVMVPHGESEWVQTWTGALWIAAVWTNKQPPEPVEAIFMTVGSANELVIDAAALAGAGNLQFAPENREVTWPRAVSIFTALLPDGFHVEISVFHSTLVNGQSLKLTTDHNATVRADVYDASGALPVNTHLINVGTSVERFITEHDAFSPVVVGGTVKTGG